jgi:hypothetical protein
MRKALVAIAAAVTLATATLLAPSPADARCDGCGLAAGLLGGLAAGAIIGSAAANAPPPPPAYVAPRPVYVVPEAEPDCYYTRRRVWDEYNGVWRRGPRELVCP